MVSVVYCCSVEENLWPTGSPIAKPATSANGSNCLYKLTKVDDKVATAERPVPILSETEITNNASEVDTADIDSIPSKSKRRKPTPLERTIKFLIRIYEYDLEFRGRSFAVRFTTFWPLYADTCDRQGIPRPPSILEQLQEIDESIMSTKQQFGELGDLQALVSAKENEADFFQKHARQIPSVDALLQYFPMEGVIPDEVKRHEMVNYGRMILEKVVPIVETQRVYLGVHLGIVERLHEKLEKVQKEVSIRSRDSLVKKGVSGIYHQ